MGSTKSSDNECRLHSNEELCEHPKTEKLTDTARKRMLNYYEHPENERLTRPTELIFNMINNRKIKNPLFLTLKNDLHEKGIHQRHSTNRNAYNKQLTTVRASKEDTHERTISGAIELQIKKGN